MTRTLTVQDVATMLAEIRDCMNEPDVASMLEVDLHEDVLRAISEGAENAQELASMALTSRQFKFARSFA